MGGQILDLIWETPRPGDYKKTPPPPGGGTDFGFNLGIYPAGGITENPPSGGDLPPPIFTGSVRGDLWNIGQLGHLTCTPS